MEKSPLFSIGTRTFVHGLFMAAGGAIIGTAQQWISTGYFPTSYVELIPVAKVTGAAVLAYVIKEYSSNSNGDLMKKEPTKEQPK